jgi:hypothetical protein
MRWLTRIARRAGRVIRGLWPDHNLVRRRVDRVEAAVVGVLAVLFLAGTPLAALIAGHLAAGSRSQAAVTILAPLATSVLLVWAGLLTHRLLERWRHRAWDADWRATEPKWTRKK